MDNKSKEQMRAAFEAWYAGKWSEWAGAVFRADEVADLRDGDKYGAGRNYLNFTWEGYEAACSSSAALPIASGDVKAQSVADMPTLSTHLLGLIGEYGLARTEKCNELEIQKRWLDLINGIKRYAISTHPKVAGGEAVAWMRTDGDVMRDADKRTWLALGGITAEVATPFTTALGVIGAPPALHAATITVEPWGNTLDWTEKGCQLPTGTKLHAQPQQDGSAT